MGGPPEWCHWNGGGSYGRRHAVRTVIKAMKAQLRPPVLPVLPGSHGHAARERERERESSIFHGEKNRYNARKIKVASFGYYSVDSSGFQKRCKQSA